MTNLLEYFESHVAFIGRDIEHSLYSLQPNIPLHPHVSLFPLSYLKLPIPETRKLLEAVPTVFPYLWNPAESKLTEEQAEFVREINLRFAKKGRLEPFKPNFLSGIVRAASVYAPEEILREHTSYQLPHSNLPFQSLFRAQVGDEKPPALI